MNLGAKSASGDVLLFLHADTLLPESWASEISSVLSTQENIGGAFCLDFDRKHWILEIIKGGHAMESQLVYIW